MFLMIRPSQPPVQPASPEAEYTGPTIDRDYEPSDEDQAAYLDSIRWDMEDAMASDPIRDTDNQRPGYVS